MVQITVRGVQCPVCNVGEIDEELTKAAGETRIAIRGFKVLMDERRGWESECLHCKQMFGNGWFAEHGDEPLESTLRDPHDTVKSRRGVLMDFFDRDGPFSQAERESFLEASEDASLGGE